ncbi:MAG: hypothetical protein ACREUF_00190, partial [Solimonas sp.]
LGALVTGVVAGAFLDWQAVVSFGGLLAINAIIGSLVCWWRPGFKAAGWKLWLTATFVNPLMVAAIAFSIDQYDCLIGERTGWNCMFAGVGPLTAAACLPSPLVGLIARWWKSRAV